MTRNCEAHVVLVNPKYSHNVGGAFRAAACFGADALTWTGRRVSFEEKERIPREERLREFRHVALEHSPRTARDLILDIASLGVTPIAVEVRDNAESLVEFIHPEQAVYVFGPEDGSLGGAELSACHRFIQIPTLACLNLAAAVNVVMYDRMVKHQ